MITAVEIKVEIDRIDTNQWRASCCAPAAAHKRAKLATMTAPTEFKSKISHRA